MTESRCYDENLDDLDNVPLASLPGLQPSTEIEIEIQNSEFTEDTVVASAIDYPNFDQDDESDLESPSASEAAASEDDDNDDDDEDSNEVIVPEVMPDEVPIDIPYQESESKPNLGSWPTLEILPGGVIKHTIDTDDNKLDEKPKLETEETGAMMYACAKCPQRFKYLFCLVKHVRWHADEKKRDEGADLSKLNKLEKQLIALKSERLEVMKKYRKKKLVIMERMARAMGELKEIKGFTDK